MKNQQNIKYIDEFSVCVHVFLLLLHPLTDNNRLSTLVSFHFGIFPLRLFWIILLLIQLVRCFFIYVLYTHIYTYIDTNTNTYMYIYVCVYIYKLDI